MFQKKIQTLKRIPSSSSDSISVSKIAFSFPTLELKLPINKIKQLNNGNL